LQQGADPNLADSKGKSGMHWAAIRGQDEIIQLLAEGGADVNLKDCNGNTALHYCGHWDTVRCLLDFGADFKARNKLGDTPEVLMRRRGVDPTIITFMRNLETEESDTDESRRPLLRRTIKHTRWPRRQRRLCSFRNVWYEFCTDLGAERLAMVLIVALILSLYIAYLATQLAKQIDTRIPVHARRNIEL